MFGEEYPDRHPCAEPGCKHTVQFDDEPYCFTHSPDSGSSVREYSYKASMGTAFTSVDRLNVGEKQ